VAAEPELRFSQTGTAILRLRVVSSDRKKNDATGEWEDSDTLWLDVTAFNKLAENCAESITKGDLVLIQGKLRTEEWTDRESGDKRSKIAMIADVIAASLVFRVIPHGTQSRVADRPAHRQPDPYAYADDSQPPF
jgi:single-strand DNA-binding protein